MKVLDDKCLCPKCGNFENCKIRIRITRIQEQLKKEYNSEYVVRIHIEKCPEFIQ